MKKKLRFILLTVLCLCLIGGVTGCAALDDAINGKVKAVVLAGTGALGMLYWKMACKDCDSIEDCDSTGIAIRKATSSVLWGMLYCTAIKVISDIAYK